MADQITVTYSVWDPSAKGLRLPLPSNGFSVWDKSPRGWVSVYENGPITINKVMPDVDDKHKMRPEAEYDVTVTVNGKPVNGVVDTHARTLTGEYTIYAPGPNVKVIGFMKMGDFDTVAQNHWNSMKPDEQKQAQNNGYEQSLRREVVSAAYILKMQNNRMPTPDEVRAFINKDRTDNGLPKRFDESGKDIELQSIGVTGSQVDNALGILHPAAAQAVKGALSNVGVSDAQTVPKEQSAQLSSPTTRPVVPDIVPQKNK